MTGEEAIQSLPDSIRIGPFDFQIEKWESRSASANSRWGEFSSLEATIRIMENMPNPVKAVDTFLHEIGHGIWFAYNLEDEDKEERIVGTEATAWTQVFRDNLWLLPWLHNALSAGEKA